MMTLLQPSGRLDAQHPWPGLAAYDEDSRPYFHGRDDDALELLRLIRLNPLSVLYGKSGLGKSSLLQAGLFPHLRDEHYLPVWVRVDFSVAAAEAPLEQVARRLAEEIVALGADAPARGAGEDLWQYLHRKDLEIWSTSNHLLTPVLVFDQFEELFSRSGGRQERIGAVFDELADLIENRIPAGVANSPDREGRARLDLNAQRYHVVLAFREDFLPDVESWKDKVPSLLRSRLRLLPMSRRQAIAATEAAGAAVLEAGVATMIVDFVANREGSASGAPSEVEPVLLSLCCTQLNRRRGANGKVDAALVASAGQDILQTFYQEALAGMPERVSRFIETCLIQGERYRGSYPRDEALAQGALTAEELAALTDVHRLLRIEQQQGVARIELIHDRLVGVVARARDQREAREREQARRAEAERLAEEARRRQQEARHRLNLRWLSLVLVLLLTGLPALYLMYREAKSQAAEALVERDNARAEAARAKAAYAAFVAERVKVEEARATQRRLEDVEQRQAQVIAEVAQTAPELRTKIEQAIDSKPLVYLQYADDRQKEMAEALRKRLGEAGYAAPGTEKVRAVPATTELRYFRQTDQPAAQELADKLLQWKVGSVMVKFVPGYASRSQLRQFELWYARPDSGDVGRLVQSLDAEVKEERLAAGQALQSGYRASPEAIAAALAMLSPERINSLSVNGRINVLYFLSRTSPGAWSPELARRGRLFATQALAQEKTGVKLGEQTRAELSRFLAVLDTADAGQTSRESGQ